MNKEPTKQPTTTNAEPHHRPPPVREFSGHPIAVLQLQFRDATFEIPGKLTSSSVRSELAQTNRARWRITYHPAMHAFQLEFFAANKTDVEQTYFVPDTGVNWWLPA